MKKRDLLSVRDLSAKEIFDIMKLAWKLKRAPLAKKGVFKDKTLAQPILKFRGRHRRLTS